MPPDRTDLHRFSPRTLTLVGSIGIALLAVSLFVEVRIIVVTPNYGDISKLVRTVWQIAVGLASLGSFLLALFNARRGNSSSEGPARHFEIKGENHDIDVHLHGLGFPKRDRSVDRPENGEPSSAEREQATNSIQERDTESAQEEAGEEDGRQDRSSR